MLELELVKTKVKCWSGYTLNRTGFLPPRMSTMQPDASAALLEMQEACGWRMEFTDAYRSVLFQIECIKGASERKRRLYAPPTKSGHNFGWSIDVAVAETLKSFSRSGDVELRTAGKDRHSLSLWMRQFGWSGIKKESWHFDFLDGHRTVLQRIDAVYGSALQISNHDLQRALNKLLDCNLVVDGALGPKSHREMIRADRVLGTDDKANAGPWFRRVLAGATAVIKEVVT
jgi:hypothetical protein